MKIKTNKFKEFLQISQMSEVETCLLEFNEDGLRMNTFNPAMVNMCRSVLKKEQFLEYSPIGNVGIDDLTKFIKVINTLGTELEFNIEGNMLIAKSNKKQLNFELVDEKFVDKDIIEKVKGMNLNEFETSFDIKVEKLSEFFNDLSINTDCLINIETVDKGVKLSNTGKYKFTYNIDSKETEKGVKLTYGEPVLKVFGGVMKRSKKWKEKDLKFNVKKNYPTKINFVTDEAEYELYTIPRDE